jgi:hypothetical protein
MLGLYLQATIHRNGTVSDHSEFELYAICVKANRLLNLHKAGESVQDNGGVR